jgi:hypothetical protein
MKEYLALKAYREPSIDVRMRWVGKGSILREFLK